MIDRQLSDYSYEELIRERYRLNIKMNEEGFNQEDDERLKAVMKELGDTVEIMADKWI